jgi:hypothetical protein
MRLGHGKPIIAEKAKALDRQIAPGELHPAAEDLITPFVTAFKRWSFRQAFLREG